MSGKGEMGLGVDKAGAAVVKTRGEQGRGEGDVVAEGVDGAKMCD